MAAPNTSPTFPYQLIVGQALVTTANTDATGATSTNMPTVRTAPSTGTGERVDRIVVTATGTTAAGLVRLFLQDSTIAPLSAPATPSVANIGSGGTILAGTYGVVVTYVNSQGETLASANTNTTTTGTTSTITITSPAAAGTAPHNATGWYAYVTQLNGTTYTRQQTAGSPTNIGSNLVLTAPPTSTGANPPTSNTAVAPPVPFKEVAVSAVTPNTTTAAFTSEVVRSDGLPVVSLPAGCSLRAATTITQNLQVLSFGGAY